VTTYIALLRAVNVGGTGKLPMQDLQAMCAKLGFTNVQTYIASGNVIFQSRHPEAKVKSALAKTLAAYAGKPVGIFVRTAAASSAATARPAHKTPQNAKPTIPTNRISSSKHQQSSQPIKSK
jgi:uncharacterized protein (DUF1697 family)